MDKRAIILYCILTNLLLGNGIIFGGGIHSNSVNWHLMIGMTLSCILCYLLVFRYINFRNWHVLKVLILSLLTCVFIVLIGCSFASVVTSFFSVETGFLNIVFKGLIIGFFLGLVGNVLMFPVTITMGIANLFWFNKYQSAQNKDNKDS